MEPIPAALQLCIELQRFPIQLTSLSSSRMDWHIHERWHFNRIPEIKVAVSFGLKWGKAHENLYLHKFKSQDKSNPINVVPHVFPSPKGISCAAVYWSEPSWYYLWRATLCSSSSWMIIRVRRTWLGFLTHKFTRFIGKGLLVAIAPPQDNKIAQWHLCEIRINN